MSKTKLKTKLKTKTKTASSVEPTVLGDTKVITFRGKETKGFARERVFTVPSESSAGDLASSVRLLIETEFMPPLQKLTARNTSFKEDLNLAGHEVSANDVAGLRQALEEILAANPVPEAEQGTVDGETETPEFKLPVSNAKVRGAIHVKSKTPRPDDSLMVNCSLQDLAELFSSYVESIKLKLNDKNFKIDLQAGKVAITNVAELKMVMDAFDPAGKAVETDLDTALKTLAKIEPKATKANKKGTAEDPGYPKGTVLETFNLTTMKRHAKKLADGGINVATLEEARRLLDVALARIAQMQQSDREKRRLLEAQFTDALTGAFGF